MTQTPTAFRLLLRWAVESDATGSPFKLYPAALDAAGQAALDDLVAAGLVSVALDEPTVFCGPGSTAHLDRYRFVSVLPAGEVALDRALDAAARAL